jgi:hypothetical protein
MSRKPVSQEVQASVLVKSRRRCCICFGLNRDTALKPGQIAHLDGNSSNGSEENLAFLCFEHHDQLDSTTRQSKNLTMQEVKEFRKELHTVIRLAFGAEVTFGQAQASADPIVGQYVRSGKYDSAEIEVTRLSDGRFHVAGHALWGKTREYGPNTGELDFLATLEGNSFDYKLPHSEGRAYRAVFVFSGRSLLIEEENWPGVFGMNVHFGGEYLKAT